MVLQVTPGSWGCFSEPALSPEINDKLLNHIILFKSGGKPWESVFAEGDNVSLCWM